jgi:protein ImuA
MSADRLTRRPHRDIPGQPFLGPLTLVPARVHEACGPARRTLALLAARAAEGPVFWIAPAWTRDRPGAEGVGALIDPGRLVFVAPQRTDDLLWCMEETLHTGAVPLVICELPAPPALTPVRRLHLAAETAARERGVKPLGLLLLPGDGGAPGVESRWHMTTAHAPGTTRWHLERRRARMAPPAAWEVTRTASGDVTLETTPVPEMA